jgi:excisionase family DNA binding protein
MDTLSSPNVQASSKAAAMHSAPAPFMLRPQTAWKTLCSRTGGAVHLGTFYRWLKNGKVYSVRLGNNIFIPRTTLEELIEQCLTGERT